MLGPAELLYSGAPSWGLESYLCSLCHLPCLSGVLNPQPAPGPSSPTSTCGIGHPAQEALHTLPRTEVPGPPELPRLECLGCVADRQVVRAVAFDPHGQLVAVGANSHCLRVCSAEAMLARPLGER